MALITALLLLQQADPLAEELKQPYLQKAPWGTDFDKAREAAKSSGKLILAYFTLTGD